MLFDVCVFSISSYEPTVRYSPHSVPTVRQCRPLQRHIALFTAISGPNNNNTVEKRTCAAERHYR